MLSAPCLHSPVCIAFPHGSSARPTAAKIIREHQTDSGWPCARAHVHARAREIIEEFSLGSVVAPVRPMGSRPRFLPIMPTSELVWLRGAATGSKKRSSEARTGSEADRNPTPSAPNITKRFGRRMTHSQGSNSRQPLGLTVLHENRGPAAAVRHRTAVVDSHA